MTLVDYFDGLACQWSKKYAEGGSMRHRIEAITRPLRDRLSTGSRVLDFGCGSGDMTLALKRAGFSASGFDVSRAMLAAARQRCEGQEIEFVQGEPGEYSRLPFGPGTFRGVVASSVLEYVPNPLAQIAELARVLANNGLLVVTVPNPSHWRRRLEGFFQALMKCPLVCRLGCLFTGRGMAYLGYLGLSINRFSLGQWAAMLSENGMRAEHVGSDSSAMATIIATKLEDRTATAALLKGAEYPDPIHCKN
ncbi:MAG: class I SAM-dependent methyltransferase [Terriglobia bacterium]